MLPARPSVIVTLANILCLMLDPTSAAARAKIVGVYQNNDRNTLLSTKVFSTTKPVRQLITPVNRESFLVSVPTTRRPVKPVDLLLYHQPDEQPVIPGVKDSLETTSTKPIHFTTSRKNDDRVPAMSSLIHPPKDGAQLSENNVKLPKPPFFINDKVVQHDLELSSLPSVRLPVVDEKELLDKMAAPQYDESSNVFKWLMMVHPADPVKTMSKEPTPVELAPDYYEDATGSMEESDYLTDEEEDYIVDETTTDVSVMEVIVTEPTLSYSTTTTKFLITTTTEPPIVTTITAKPKLKTDQPNLEPRQQVELEQLPAQIPNPFLFQVEGPGRDRTAEKSDANFKPLKTNYEMDKVYGGSMYSNSQQVSNQFDMYQQNKPVITQKPVSGSNFVVTSKPAGPPYINPTPANSLIDLFFNHEHTKPAIIQIPISNPNVNPVTPPTNLFDLLLQHQTKPPVHHNPIGSMSVTPPTNLFDLLLQHQTKPPVNTPIGSSSINPVTPPTNLFDFLLQQPVNSPSFQFPFGSGTTTPSFFELLFQQQTTKPPVNIPVGSSTTLKPPPSNLFDYLFQQQTTTKPPVNIPIGSSTTVTPPPSNLFDFLLQQQTTTTKPPVNVPIGSSTTVTPPPSNLFDFLFQQQTTTKPPVNVPIGSSTTVTPPPSNLFDFLFLQPPPKPPITTQTPITSGGSNVNTVTFAPFRPPLFTTTTRPPLISTSNPLDIFKPQQPAGPIESQMGNSNGNFNTPGLTGGVLRPPFFNLPVSSQPIQQPTKPTSAPMNQMDVSTTSTTRPTKAPSTGPFDLFQQEKPVLSEYQMGNSFIQPPVNSQPLSVGSSFLQLPSFALPGYYQMGGYYYYPATTTNLTTTTPGYSSSSNLPCPPTSTSTSGISTGSFTTTTSRPPPYWPANPSTVWSFIPTIQPPGSPTIRPPFLVTTQKPNPPTVRPPDPPTISPPSTSTSPSTPSTISFIDSTEVDPPTIDLPSLGTFFVASSGSSGLSSSSSGSTSASGTGTDVTSTSGFSATGVLLFFFFIGLPIVIGVVALFNFSDIVLGALIAGVIPIALFLILGVTGALTTKRSISAGNRWFWRIMTVDELTRLEQHVVSLLESFPYREDER